MLMSFIPEGIGMSLPVYAITFGDFDYDLDGAGKATIKGYYGPGGNVEIPETLDDHQVVSIGDSVFSNKTNITSVMMHTGRAITLKKSELNALLYTGKAPNTKYLVPGDDFTVTYKNNVGPGTAKVIVKGLGDYGGTMTLTFKIKAKKSNVIEMILKAVGN